MKVLAETAEKQRIIDSALRCCNILQDTTQSMLRFISVSLQEAPQIDVCAASTTAKETRKRYSQLWEHTDIVPKVNTEVIVESFSDL